MYAMADGGAAAPSNQNFMRKGAQQDQAQAESVMLAAPQPTAEITIRKEFPESWMFDSLNKEEGLVQLVKFFE